jgi:hypothetical protein
MLFGISRRRDHTLQDGLEELLLPWAISRRAEPIVRGMHDVDPRFNRGSLFSFSIRVKERHAKKPRTMTEAFTSCGQASLSKN